MLDNTEIKYTGLTLGIVSSLIGFIMYFQLEPGFIQNLVGGLAIFQVILMIWLLSEETDIRTFLRGYWRDYLNL